MGARSAAVFSELDEGQVDRILSVLGGADAGQSHGSMVRALRGLGLGPRQAREVAGWLRDMRTGTANPGLAMGMLEGMDADGRARGLAVRMFRGLLDARGREAAAGAPPAHGNTVNSEPFHRFVSLHKDDPELRGKYVAFVHGRLQKCGPSGTELIREMRERFGNVRMCVGRVEEPRTYRVGCLGLARARPLQAPAPPTSLPRASSGTQRTPRTL